MRFVGTCKLTQDMNGLLPTLNPSQDVQFFIRRLSGRERDGKGRNGRAVMENECPGVWNG
jgi:hypothetical protein